MGENDDLVQQVRLAIRKADAERRRLDGLARQIDDLSKLHSRLRETAPGSANSVHVRVEWRPGEVGTSIPDAIVPPLLEALRAMVEDRLRQAVTALEASRG